MGCPRPIFMLLLLSFVGLASAGSYVVLGGSKEDDEYWDKREEETRKLAKELYVQDPYIVTNSLNAAVHKAMDRKNSSRRGLGSIMKSSCRATNPIDRCWRCRADWADNRQKLAGCAKGFGRKAFGGGPRSQIYVVTDESDDAPNQLAEPKFGTLRWGAIQQRPLWIIFARDMNITLQQELMITSKTTIDGRGAVVRILNGAGFTIQSVKSVIIHGIHMHDLVPKEGGMIRDTTRHVGLRTRSDGDAINIFSAANIWIDHVSLARCKDGLIDAIQGSTAITISNCYFTEHNDVMLLGGSEGSSFDQIMQVTVAFNHFGPQLQQRMPRGRFGFIHVVNNDYTEWTMYAIGGSKHPTIVSQGNRFTAHPTKPEAREVTKRDYAAESEWRTWNWTSEGDTFINGAYFRASGPESSLQLTKNFSRFDVFRSKPGSYVARLTRYAGALHCKVGEPC